MVKFNAMIVNERIRAIRMHKGWTSQRLAQLAGLSPAAISRLERQSRLPRFDTIQKIAAAFDVSLSFLGGDEDSDIPLPRALARQSLERFLNRTPGVPGGEKEYLSRVAENSSAPESIDDWRKLLANIAIYENLTHGLTHE